MELLRTPETSGNLLPHSFIVITQDNELPDTEGVL